MHCYITFYILAICELYVSCALSSSALVLTGNRVAELMKSFSLSCSFDSVLNVNAIFWFKETNLLYGQKGTVIFYRQPNVTVPFINFTTTAKHDLTFDLLLPRDVGTYKCLVETEIGIVSEAVFAISIPPTELTVKKGQNISLKCEIVGLIADSEIIWFKDNSYIDFNRQHKRGGKIVNYSLNKQGELSIKNVTQFDEASFSCYNQGLRMHVYKVKLHQDVKTGQTLPPPQDQLHGFAFGITLGVVVSAVLITLYFIQTRLPYAWEKDLKKKSTDDILILNDENRSI